MKLWFYIPSILILSHLNSFKIVWFRVEGLFFIVNCLPLKTSHVCQHMVQTLMQEDYWPHGSFPCFQSNGRCHVSRKGVASCPSSHPTHVITKKEVSNQLFQLHTTYMSIKLFFDCVNAYWVPKIYMWCIGAQNIPHANHDMNATIKA